MKTTLPLAAAVLAAVTATGTRVEGGDRNAADWYARASENLPALTDEQWELVHRYRRRPSGEPPAALRELLARTGRAVALAQRGAGQAFCDHALDYGRGHELTLPHLHDARELAWLMQADAMVRLHDGDTGGAIDRIAAAQRMGSHMAADHTVISSLVGQMIWKVGDEGLQSMLDRGAVGPAEAMELLRAAEALPEADPFAYVDATMMEFALVASTIEAQLRERGTADLGLLLGDLEEGVEPPPALSADEAAEQLEGFGAYIDEAVEIFVANDPQTGEAALDVLGAKVAAGEYETIAKYLSPALDKVFERKVEAERQIAQRIGTLRAIAGGELAARSQANAALWYLRAIKALAAKAPEGIEALRRDGAAPGAPLDPAVASLMGECDDVVGLLREAVEIPRCDFEVAREPGGPLLAPPYAGGLRDLLALVQAEVRRRAGEAEGGAELDRLRIGWSMLRHLDGDPMFTTAITAHDGFRRLLALTEHASEAGRLDADGRGELSALARQLGRTDPFGYAAAIVRARVDLAGPLRRAVVFLDDADDQRRNEAIGGALGAADGDVLLYLSALLDARAHLEDERWQEAARRALAPLAGTLDLDAVAQAWPTPGRRYRS